MAILECPECEGKVSSYAEKCPHCGCPIDIIIDELKRRTISIVHDTFGKGTIVKTEHDTISIQFENEKEPRRFSKKLIRDKIRFFNDAAKQRFWDREDADTDKHISQGKPATARPWSPYSGIQYEDSGFFEEPDYMAEDDIDERMDDNFYTGDGDDWGGY